jgi:putative heme-binding domain-containing protein
MAPDLTTIGRSRSAAYLRESMTAPDAVLSPGYNTIRVVTRDGKSISGVQRAYDAFSAQFVDASDNYYSFLRDEVKSMKREVKSLMPAYDKSLTARELDDLLAYMASLRGAQ